MQTLWAIFWLATPHGNVFGWYCAQLVSYEYRLWPTNAAALLLASLFLSIFLASFPGRSHRQYFIASSMKYVFVFHAGRMKYWHEIHYFILEAMKYWRWERPGNEASIVAHSLSPRPKPTPAQIASSSTHGEGGSGQVVVWSSVEFQRAESDCLIG